MAVADMRPAGIGCMAALPPRSVPPLPSVDDTASLDSWTRALWGLICASDAEFVRSQTQLGADIGTFLCATGRPDDHANRRSVVKDATLARRELLRVSVAMHKREIRLLAAHAALTTAVDAGTFRIALRKLQGALNASRGDNAAYTVALARYVNFGPLATLINWHAVQGVAGGERGSNYEQHVLGVLVNVYGARRVHGSFTPPLPPDTAGVNIKGEFDGLLLDDDFENTHRISRVFEMKANPDLVLADILKFTNGVRTTVSSATLEYGTPEKWGGHHFRDAWKAVTQTQQVYIIPRVPTSIDAYSKDSLMSISSLVCTSPFAQGPDTQPSNEFIAVLRDTVLHRADPWRAMDAAYETRITELRAIIDAGNVWVIPAARTVCSYCAGGD
jgi:hypothetical protein